MHAFARVTVCVCQCVGVGGGRHIAEGGHHNARGGGQGHLPQTPPLWGRHCPLHDVPPMAVHTT